MCLGKSYSVFGRLRMRRQALAPEVEKYREYAQRLDRHRGKKADFLKNYAEQLEASANGLSIKVTIVLISYGHIR